MINGGHAIALPTLRSGRGRVTRHVTRTRFAECAGSHCDQRFAGYICRAAPDTRMLAPGSEVISACSRDGIPMSSPCRISILPP